MKNLKKYLHYDPKTGIWTWIVSRGRMAKAGQRAGWVHHTGHRLIIIEGKQYYEHRLAWLYMTGQWPKQIDHIDGIASNNRWTNLRIASQRQNMMNQRKQYRVTLKGISRSYQRFRARIKVTGKSIHLGYFSSAKKAHAAYVAAAKKHFGEFARAR